MCMSGGGGGWIRRGDGAMQMLETAGVRAFQWIICNANVIPNPLHFVNKKCPSFYRQQKPKQTTYSIYDVNEQLSQNVTNRQ